MKKAILAIVLSGAFATSAMASETCNETIASTKASNIADQIATADGINIDVQTFVRIRAEEEIFYVIKGYDQGLSVPGYEIKLSKTDCSILEIKYTNFEG
ncbi:MAG: hypothetical protein AB7T49_07815 [Oligoflexales bacterium]